MSGDLHCPTPTEVLVAMAYMVGELHANRIWVEACKANQMNEKIVPKPDELRDVLQYILKTKGLAGLAARSQLVRLESFLARKVS